ncbi:OLC1v1029821C1 [Oldenlandia corymbosa var. corymbosa]|uniref:OLC1v1029821C1 n=1 Tax=Oldenlandia corymbosa var. corymbosa TaxID=529605 RepID=A0AAV1CFD4_OLDCO|nr:OLC1v1029821C1 [Oldenlandia corymbosa var. corymbosa]
MDLVSKYQGYVGRVFGNENSDSNEDSYVERLLDRISNGKLAEDRRTAMVELQSVVAENRGGQLAFGAMGFPVLLSVLREERDDVEMVRGALETLISALTPIDHSRGPKNEVQPALMNSDLLSREADSISLLLNLLAEDDFYVRYYTLQLLTALLTNSPTRLQEAILTIPNGIIRLMDMLLEREVIRNEALLLLTYLTREAEEIQKIVVFEGAFEKIFSIIKEEGGSDGGVVVQDCLELLNNLLRTNASNQVMLRETLGFDPLISILRLRGSAYKFTQQKTINLLSVLETIQLLIYGGQEADPSRHTNRLTNITALVKVLDQLLMLGVESQWAPVPVRCAALQCIGDLIAGHPQNRDLLATKLLGEEPNVESALNSILRIILRTSSVQEFIAADYVFKSFCEKNPDGQKLLASTLTPQPQSMTYAPYEDDVHMSFGSMLLHGLTMSESNGDLETCCRAASVLSHVLKDNLQCKEKVLRIELEAPVPTLGGSEPLMHRMVKYLALSSSMKSNDGKSSARNTYVEPVILKLLIVWLSGCPSAVQCFLDSRPHLTYLLELVSNPATTVCTRGLAAVLLGECIIYNTSTDSGKDAFSIADAISQKIGLTSYFLKFDEMQKSLLFTSAKPALSRKPLTRSTAASMAEIEDVDENEALDQKNDHPMLVSTFDLQFVNFVKQLEGDIRDKTVEIYSHPKSQVAVVPAELEQRNGEADADYIKRLKSFLERQCLEIQDLLSRNATLAEDVARTGGSGSSGHERRPSSGAERVQVETLRRDLYEASQRLEMLKTEKSQIESEAETLKNFAAKMEAELQSLSNAYNSLEQTNIQLEDEVKALRSGGSSGGGMSAKDIEALKAEAREEAQKESEAELSDLLVCLGQEQSKVERLSARLMELGEDVDKLLEDIGDDDDAGLGEDDEEDED